MSKKYLLLIRETAADISVQKLKNSPLCWHMFASVLQNIIAESMSKHPSEKEYIEDKNRHECFKYNE